MWNLTYFSCYVLELQFQEGFTTLAVLISGQAVYTSSRAEVAHQCVDVQSDNKMMKYHQMNAYTSYQTFYTIKLMYNA